MAIRAKNTVWFKAFNDDYHSGGIYHCLDNSEFRTIVILQSYVNADGIVCKQSGVPYSLKELSDMVGLDPRATRRSLFGLEEKKVITMNTNSIEICNFVTNQVYRESNPQATLARRKLGTSVARIEQKLEAVHIVDKETGEIL